MQDRDRERRHSFYRRVVAPGLGILLAVGSIVTASANQAAADHWAGQFTQKQSEVYAAIYQAQTQGKGGSVSLELEPGLRGEAFQQMFRKVFVPVEQYLFGQRPEVFWMGNGQVRYSTSGSASYETGVASQYVTFGQRDNDKILSRQKKVDGAVTRFKEQSGIASAATVTEKVVVINNWITSQAAYDESAQPEGYSYEMTGVLVDGSAVCDGYAKAFKFLSDIAGVSSLYVPGTVRSPQNGGWVEENHAWNYVQLENGSWYLVDPTWNDPMMIGGGDNSAYRQSYLLKGSADYVDGVKIADSHIPDPASETGFQLPTLSETGVALVKGAKAA